MGTTYSDVITISALPDTMRVIYSKELSMTAAPSLIFDQFSEPKGDFAGEHGDEVVWTVYRQLPPRIRPLQENVDVDGGKMQDFQVRFRVYEYGAAMGTTKKLDVLSYHGPISNIVKNTLAPQMALSFDLLARNAMLAPRNKTLGLGTSYHYYGDGTRANRAAVTSGDTISETIIKTALHRLSANRVPPLGGGYVCITNQDVTRDLKELAGWVNAQYYAGTDRIFTGEVGMLHGCRFVEADTAKLPNAGATTGGAETTMSAASKVGDDVISVVSTTGIVAGDQVSVYPAADSTPDGTNELDESVVVDEVVDATTLRLKTGLMNDHASGSKVREAIDIYPLFFLGNQTALGKGIVIPPTVKVAPPQDKLGRISYVGWYTLLGYGILREWAMVLWEVASAHAMAPAFPG